MLNQVSVGSSFSRPKAALLVAPQLVESRRAGIGLLEQTIFLVLENRTSYVRVARGGDFSVVRADPTNI